MNYKTPIFLLLMLFFLGGSQVGFSQLTVACDCGDYSQAGVGLFTNLTSGPNDPPTGQCCYNIRLSNIVANRCDMQWPVIRLSQTSLPGNGWPFGTLITAGSDWQLVPSGPGLDEFVYTGSNPNLPYLDDIVVATICIPSPLIINYSVEVDFQGCSFNYPGTFTCTEPFEPCEESCYWTVNGNDNTNDLNFLGQNTFNDLRIGTDGLERMRVLSDGRIGINGVNSSNFTPQAQVDINGNLALSNPPPFGRKILTGSDSRLNLHLNTDAVNSTSWIELHGFDQGNGGLLNLAGNKVQMLHSSDGGNTSQIGTVGFAMNNDGNVGIGTGSLTTPPIARLDVRGDNIFQAAAGTSGAQTKFTAMGESGGSCDIYGFRAQTTNTRFINMGMQVAGSTRVPVISWGLGDLEFISDRGSGCGSKVMELHNPKTVSGNTNVVLELFGRGLTNGTLITSDRRMKTGIEALKSPLETVRLLNGVSYKMRADEFPEYNFGAGRQLGFIAQDLQEVLPELVAERENGFLAVNYDGVIPVLVEAVKELDTRQQANTDQAEAIEALQAQNAALLDRLSQLEIELNNLCESGCAGLERPQPELQGARLEQNVPNPFSRQTTIGYFLPQGASSASLVIAYLDGKVMKTMELDPIAGEGSFVLQTDGLAGGTYVYSLLVDGETVASRKLVLGN